MTSAARHEQQVPLGFGDLRASAGDHIGHFYQTKDEWKDLLVSFLKAGLEAGDKCVYHITPGSKRDELLEALASNGIDVETALASEQLVVSEGGSDPQAMEDSLHRALTEIPEKYRLLRWGGDMSWSLEKLPSTEKLMEWESHCNVIENPLAVFLCQYDLTMFHGNVVMDALRTHPLCIVSNVIHRNPLYEKPEVFLEELRLRGAKS